MAQCVLEDLRIQVEASPSRTARIAREALLLGSLLAVYLGVRYLALRHSTAAFSNAELVVGLENALRLPSEANLQHDALPVPHLAQAANGYYALVHFPLTVSVLLWLSVRHRAVYPRVRWAMVSVTALATVGHLVFPLAPPRMLPGFIDTGVRYGQSVYGPTTDSGVANQFAAMPSLHVGWATMIAIVLVLVTRSRWRWLWLLHPVLTFAVVVLTANHYWLDGLVALALVGLCLPILIRPRPRTAVW
jgi:hypothetical protein